MFAACYVVVTKRSPLLMEYGLTQESQLLLHENVGPHPSSTISYAALYKALLLGDGRELLAPNPAFHMDYQNGLRAEARPTPKTSKRNLVFVFPRRPAVRRICGERYGERKVVLRKLLSSQRGHRITHSLNLFRNQCDRLQEISWSPRSREDHRSYPCN